MKIRIEFTKEEKVAIMNATDTQLQDNDNPVTVTGKFGSVDYDPSGSIEYNLKSDFIMSIASIIDTFISLIKSLLNYFNIFEKMWFSDIKIIKADEKETIEHYENSIRKECEEYKKYYKKPDDDNKIIKESPLNKVGDIIDEILNNNKEE